MNIFAFTNKGTETKINTDTILFNSESVSGNPILINEQNNYSHFINNIEGTAIAMAADGLGDTFASKLSIDVYNENFLDLLELVGEQEIMNWIMHNFIKLEVIAARDSADDKNKAMAGLLLQAYYIINLPVFLYLMQATVKFMQLIEIKYFK